MTCPLGIQPNEEKTMTRLASDHGELDDGDVAELGQLLSQCRRPVNVAFLGTLADGGAVPLACGPVAALDESDTAEVRALLTQAARASSVALLASMLRPATLGAADDEAAADVAEASRLHERCTRGVPRAYAQLTRAQLVSDLVRGCAAAAAERGGEAPVDPPVELPSMESSVLLVHSAAMRARAHEVAALLCADAPALGPLPAPFEGGCASPLRLVTRYYSATLSLVLLPDTDAAHARIEELAKGAGALIILFDSSERPVPGSSFAEVSGRWSAALAGGAPEIFLVLGAGGWSGGAREGQLEWYMDRSIAEHTGGPYAMPWYARCLDRAGEHVLANPEAEAAETAEYAVACRGEAPMPDLAGETEGLCRVLEALQCRMWPPDGGAPRCDA
jgi:hypothetical protein